MVKRILYCGDHLIDDAARYLACILKHLGYSFDYIPSDQKLPNNISNKQYKAYIFSDYPSKRISSKQMEKIRRFVFEGSSFLMIGGWGSFKGVDGNYNKTILREVVPVRCQGKDDRVQGDHHYRITKKGKSKHFNRLSFDTSPTIAGFNRVVAKKDSKTILEVGTYQFNSKLKRASLLRKDPLLVLSPYGMGRSVALMTDLAPHWSGGLVDWGKKRKSIMLRPKIGVELGENYLKFVEELIALIT